uniref:Uncharacterized protein n=1 Tax=Anguilla anguilla TaxID=7936 RepID=A0A0E9VGI0_ANGAN
MAEIFSVFLRFKNLAVSGQD